MTDEYLQWTRRAAEEEARGNAAMLATLCPECWGVMPFEADGVLHAGWGSQPDIKACKCGHQRDLDEPWLAHFGTRNRSQPTGGRRQD